MSTILGHLNSTIPFSVVDGPGNRFVLFLQGCNFNCISCHNPYTIAECNSCGLCVDPCPEDALLFHDDLNVALDRSRCTDCNLCIDICPYESSPLTRWVSVGDLIDEIRRAAPFISGITASGGEATLQAPFLAELFAAIKSDPALSHLSTMVDTNGSTTLRTWRILGPVMDGAMVDLKALDAETHHRLTARGNKEVLESIEHLAKMQKLYEVRLLIMPGYNDDEVTLRQTARWLAEVDPAMRLKIIGFRSHGVRVEASHVPEPTAQQMEEIESIFEDAGFNEITVV